MLLPAEEEWPASSFASVGGGLFVVGELPNLPLTPPNLTLLGFEVPSLMNLKYYFFFW